MYVCVCVCYLEKEGYDANEKRSVYISKFFMFFFFFWNFINKQFSVRMMKGCM